MIKIKYIIFISTFVIIATLCGGFQAYASNNTLNQSLEYAGRNKQTISAIRSARIISQEGIKISVIFPDNSTTTIILRDRTESLTPEGSIQLFKVPSTNQILNTSFVNQRIYDNNYFPRYQIELFEAGIRNYLSQSLEDVVFEAKPASYIIVSNKVEIEPHSLGQTANIDSIISLIKNKLRNLDSNNINVFIENYNPDTTLEILEANKNFARAILKWKGVTLTYNSHKINLSGRNILSSIRFDTKGNLYLDIETIRAKLRLHIGHLIEKPAVPPLFEIVNNRLAVKSEGAYGYDVDVDEIASKISEYLSYRMHDYTNENLWPSPKYNLSITKYSRNLTKSKLLNMGIDSLLGKSRISYKGSSSDRIHNIVLGSLRVTGTIVKPGQEFSLVEAIGYTSTSTGYKEEYVIKNNRSLKEAGGGLCQVATTFFRAALDSGLKVSERHNHRYVVSYYGPGLDAGIYDINHDFRFINDTPNKILLQAYTENGDMVVEIFGKSDGRNSITSKPLETKKIGPPKPQYYFGNSIRIGKKECTDRPKNGMTTYATTTITYKDGTKVTKVWKSVYTPWPKICIIGTKGLGSFLYNN